MKPNAALCLALCKVVGVVRLKEFGILTAAKPCNSQSSTLVILRARFCCGASSGFRVGSSRLFLRFSIVAVKNSIVSDIFQTTAHGDVQLVRVCGIRSE
jgi:hypothetical protein